MPTYKILSLDGGGIRGLFTAVLLHRLSAQVPGFLDRADLLAGTSTGGILALGLADKMSTVQLVKLYKDHGKAIFSSSWLHKVRDLGDVIGAKYSNANLISIIRAQFGDRTLNDLLPRRVLIPTFDLDKPAKGHIPRMWNPKYFHNFPGSESDGAQKIADVVLRTSAAPTFFPVYQGYVDGGVAANNPAMSALAQALDKNTGNQALADIRLFSVGTGLSPVRIPGESNNWGIFQWARHLPEMLIEGMMGVADYECARLLHHNYFRLAPVLPHPIPLDAAGKIDELIAQAEKADLAPAVNWLNANF